jgi:hypothetical protein
MPKSMLPPFTLPSFCLQNEKSERGWLLKPPLSSIVLFTFSLVHFACKVMACKVMACKAMRGVANEPLATVFLFQSQKTE